MRDIDGQSWVRRGAIVGLAALVLTGGSVFGSAELVVDETKPASATGLVEIEGVSGKFTITGTDQAAVSVKGTLDEAAVLHFTSSGDHTVIMVKLPRAHSFSGINRNGMCDLAIQVPAGSNVSASLVSADVKASGVNGELRLETVSGDVTVSDHPAEVEAKSVSGDVKILATTSRLKAETVSGGVTIQGPDGEAEVSSVSGDLEVNGGRFRNLDASTVSGDLSFAGDLTPDSQVDLSSHSGDVELKLPATISARFEMQTFSGDITNGFSDSQAGEDESGVGGRKLTFTVGAGDARIKVNSFSGSVKLTKS
jgi:Putative adhesin